jgi:hypothetical protein
MRTAQKQNEIATQANRTLRTGAVIGLRWVWRRALFIKD